MGGWRRRLQDNPVTDFCDHFPEWGTFYNLAEKTVEYAPEKCLASEGVEQSVCDAHTTDGVWDQDKCDEDADNCRWGNDPDYFTALGCSVMTCGDNDDEECMNQGECEAEVDGVWDAWTDNEGNPAGNATPQECDTLRTWADERKSFIQDPDNIGAPGYAEALHTMILLENHYACCTIRSGTALQIMDLLSRINLLCSSYDATACDVAAEGSASENDCTNVFAVCPAVTAPEGQGGLDLDAIGNYGAVVIGVNENFAASSQIEEERRRLTEENCAELNKDNAMNAGFADGEGKASLLLSWGTEYYGQQLGHVALIIGDLDHTQDNIPLERWVSFGPASNSADYQSSISLGDTYDLLQGMKPKISEFTNEYGLFDDYITFTNVNEQAMIDAWATIRASPGRYSLIDRNCMTVVADIMNAGMAEQCAVTRRNIITPHAFFQTMQELLADQLEDKDSAEIAMDKELVRRAFTPEKVEVPECSEQCDLPDTHPFHCQRTSYREMRGNRRDIVVHEKDSVECMQLVKDMKCEYGSLCRNPHYKQVEDNCSNYEKKTECVTARIWKSRVEDLKKIERDSMCMWVAGSCQDYTPGDCRMNEMQDLGACNTNHHVCELEFYRASTQTTECADLTTPTCPSVGGFPSVHVEETAISACRNGAERKRKCESHNNWGAIQNPKCSLSYVFPNTDSPAPAPTPAPTPTGPYVAGRRLIDLDEMAEQMLF